MTVDNDCTITAPNISFGSASVISSFATVTGQTINLACTKGSAYTVGLDDGQHAVGVGGRRRMISGSNYLAYDLLKKAPEPLVGAASARPAAPVPMPRSTPATAWEPAARYSTTTPKSTPTRARPPPGTYLDSVVLDVGFFRKNLNTGLRPSQQLAPGSVNVNPV